MKQGQLTGLRRALKAKKQRSPEQLAQWLEDLREAYISAAQKSADEEAVRRHNERAEKAGEAAALLRIIGEQERGAR